MGTIVVAVDGSAGSIEALKWAVNEAQVRKASVRVVTAWDFPYAYGGLTAAVIVPTEDLEREARALQDSAVSAAVPDPAVADEIQRVVLSGSPAMVVLDASEGADLLVVGARGHGGFMGLLLGSVSDQVVRHAPCPVAVIRNPQSP